MKPQVSSFGRYKNVHGVVSTPKPKKTGYVEIMIKKRTRLLHRVMAAAFRLPRLPEQTEVDHINGLPWDNRLSNLRCASRSEQMKYSYANPNRGKSGLRRSKPIYGRRVGSTEWVFYRSGREAEEKLGLDRNVRRVCDKFSTAGTRKTTHGYEFKYAEGNEPEIIEGERWAPFETGYVSSFGRFRNVYGVISTPQPSRSGYARIEVNKKVYLLHRAIAIAFQIPKRDDQDTVDHVNAEPSNNCLENLRWATQCEQNNYSHATNAQRGTNASRMCRPIRGRRVGTDEWTLYSGGNREASRALNMSSGNISQVCNGKLHSIRGYQFEFANPTEPDVLEGEVWADVLSEDEGM